MKQQREPMTINRHVHTTTDYFLFKSIGGNRNKNLLHINRLKKSMQEHYLFTVIIVNEHYEIIDGQHRFDCIVDLKLPLNYIICSGYGLNEVHILNQNSKTWNADDYLTGYVNLGNKEYIKFAEFKTKYGIGHNETLALLTGGRQKSIDTFYTGQFKVANYEAACVAIEKILMVLPYYGGAKRKVFIFAMLSLLQNEKFSFDEFMHKLKMQPTAMQDCVSTTAYIAMIEVIYNFRRSEKVNLRY